MRPAPSRNLRRVPGGHSPRGPRPRRADDPGVHRARHAPARVPYRSADGAIRWMEARGECPTTRRGRAQRLRGICMDVTSRKTAEAERERLARAGARGPRASGGRGAAPGLHGRDRPVDHRLAGRHHRAPAHRRRRAWPSVRSDGASIFLREGDTLRPRYRVGPWPEIYQTLRIRPGESIGGEVMLTGKPTRSEDYASDPRVPPSHAVLAQQTGMVCVMVVPIVIRTQVAGLLYISNRTRRVFTDEDETVCTRLAEQAAIAIQNAELFARRGGRAAGGGNARTSARTSSSPCSATSSGIPRRHQQCRACHGPGGERGAAGGERAGDHQPPGRPARAGRRRPPRRLPRDQRQDRARPTAPGPRRPREARRSPSSAFPRTRYRRTPPRSGSMPMRPASSRWW